jgi:hypothetical protein
MLHRPVGWSALPPWCGSGKPLLVSATRDGSIPLFAYTEGPSVGPALPVHGARAWDLFISMTLALRTRVLYTAAVAVTITRR